MAKKPMSDFEVVIVELAETFAILLGIMSVIAVLLLLTIVSLWFVPVYLGLFFGYAFWLSKNREIEEKGISLGAHPGPGPK